MPKHQLSTKGKIVKEMVLPLLQNHAHLKIRNEKWSIIDLLNAEGIDKEEKGKKYRIGSADDIISKYEKHIENILYWEKYMQIVGELENL